MITNISSYDGSVQRYKKFEVSFGLSGNYTNPFNVSDVEVWGSFVGPEHTKTTVPGFFDQPFKVKAPDDPGEKEKLVEDGNCRWVLRFAPPTIGDYEFRINVRYQQGPRQVSDPMTFQCVAGPSRGFIRRSDESPFLHYDDGSTYLPIGHNLCWDDDKDPTFLGWYTSRLNSMTDAQENWTRLWMQIWGRQGLAIEWTPNDYAQGHAGLGQYSLQSAWKVDRILEVMEAAGIATQLVFEAHVNWKRDTPKKKYEWVNNPYNKNNKHNNKVETPGFLENPGDFFSNERARKFFKQRLRYIVARWSHSTSIMAWEFFNEMEHIDGFKDVSDNARAWHEEMADYLRETDPSNHLIATSSFTRLTKPIDSIPEIDLLQPHIYSENMIDTVDATCRNLKATDKPILIGEFGTAITGIEYPEDQLCEVSEPPSSQMEQGLHVHNGMWTAAFNGASAQHWYWNYIHQQDLYGHFPPLAMYWKKENLTPELQPASVELANEPRRKGLWISTGPLGFDDKATQNEFTVEANGSIPGKDQIHPYLHGSWKDDLNLRTDPTFVIEVGDGELLIHGNRVSPYDDAATIEVLVDGNVEEGFRISKHETDFLRATTIAAGRHRVQIRNTGKDWADLSGYEFTGCVHSALRVHGLADSDRAFLWVTDIGNQLNHQPATSPFEHVTAKVNGLQDADYTVQFFGTQPNAGGLQQETTAICSNGELAFELPRFEHDIAFKCKRKDNGE